MKVNFCMVTVEQIIKLFAERGDSQYGGEAVTQRQHALQCAALAVQAHASPALVTAALLHDIGHLVHALPDDAPDQGVDDAHEELGYRYLRQIFDESVTEPVRLHVPAKCYLCAVNSYYHAQLSEPSIVSLKLQGGPMSETEVAEFRAGSFAEDAVSLRRWDDLAKVADLATPAIEDFEKYLQAAAMHSMQQKAET